MILLYALAAFAGQGHVGYSLDGTVTPERARAITRGCKVPNRWLTVRKDGSVRLRLPDRAPYADVDCLLRQLRPSDEDLMSFIGNEPIRPKPVEKPK